MGFTRDDSLEGRKDAAEDGFGVSLRGGVPAALHDEADLDDLFAPLHEVECEEADIEKQVALDVLDVELVPKRLDEGGDVGDGDDPSWNKPNIKILVENAMGAYAKLGPKP